MRIYKQDYVLFKEVYTVLSATFYQTVPLSFHFDL